jgi:hypothetical protein
MSSTRSHDHNLLLLRGLPREIADVRAGLANGGRSYAAKRMLVVSDRATLAEARAACVERLGTAENVLAAAEWAEVDEGLVVYCFPSDHTQATEFVTGVVAAHPRLRATLFQFADNGEPGYRWTWRNEQQATATRIAARSVSALILDGIGSYHRN